MKKLTFIILCLFSFSSFSQRNLYGLLPQDGKDGLGTIFKTDSDGTNFQRIYEFKLANPGIGPFTGMLLAPNNKFYGLTYNGGDFGFGVLYEFDPSNKKYQAIIHFDEKNGANPNCELTLAKNGLLYGTTTKGGGNNFGTLFKFDYKNYSFEKIYDFNYADGLCPLGGLVEVSGNKLFGQTGYPGYNNFKTSYAGLYSFDYESLQLKQIVKFPRSQLIYEYPVSKMLLSSDSLLYGITYSDDYRDTTGSLFVLNPINLEFKRLVWFTEEKGSRPYGGLLEIENKVILGSTSGGPNNTDYRGGTIFSYNPIDKSFKTLKKIMRPSIRSEDDSTGWGITSALLKLDNGNYLAATKFGGGVDTSFHGSGDRNDRGSIIEYNVSLDSIITKRRTFKDFNSGSFPMGNLKKGPDGKYYGVCQKGGLTNSGIIYSYSHATNEILSEVHFNTFPNGAMKGGLIFQSDSNDILGIAAIGGKFGQGVLFKLNTKNNTFSKLYDINEFPIYDYNNLNSTESLVKHFSPLVDGVSFGKFSNNLVKIDFKNPAVSIYPQKVAIDFWRFHGNPLPLKNGSLLLPFSGDTLYNEYGAIFELKPGVDTLIPIYQFTKNEMHFLGPNLIDAGNGLFYGLSSGPTYNGVQLFSFDYSTKTMKIVMEFDSGVYNEKTPGGFLSKGKGNNIIGSTYPMFVLDPIQKIYNSKSFGGDVGIYNNSNLFFESKNQIFYGVSGNRDGKAFLFNYNLILDSLIITENFECDKVAYFDAQLLEIDFTKKQVGISTHELGNYGIYPNPTNSRISIMGLQGNEQIILFNSIGQEVLSQHSKNLLDNSLNLSQMPVGLYYLKITNENGLFVNLKVVKQ